MLVPDVSKRRRDAVEEGLRADKSVIRKHVRAVGQVLTRPEPDLEVQRAAKEKPVPVQEPGATLLPASVTTAPKEEEPAAEKKPGEELNVEAVFAKLKQLGGKGDDKEPGA